MLSKNLMRLPTEQELYDRLDLIPCHVSFEKKVDAQANKKSFIRGKVMYGDLEENELNALSTFVSGTHMVTTVSDLNRDIVRTTFDGDNKFAVQIIKNKLDHNKVEITTSINDGTSEHFNKTDYQADSASNATVIKQVFRVVSEDLDAVLESAEIVQDGYNKVGAPIPTYADTNILSNQLARIYSTSRFVKSGGQQLQGFWGSLLKTGATVGGSIIGGIAGTALGGPAGTVGGASLVNTIGGHWWN